MKQFQNILLTQLLDQLRFYTELADKHHGESLIRTKYARAHQIVSEIWKESEIDRGALLSDSITKNIQTIR